jgi:hypothetical protein
MYGKIKMVFMGGKLGLLKYNSVPKNTAPVSFKKMFPEVFQTT